MSFHRVFNAYLFYMRLAENPNLSTATEEDEMMMAGTPCLSVRLLNCSGKTQWPLYKKWVRSLLSRIFICNKMMQINQTNRACAEMFGREYQQMHSSRCTQTFQKFSIRWRWMGNAQRKSAAYLGRRMPKGGPSTVTHS